MTAARRFFRDAADDDDPREARALARTLRKMIYGSRRRTDTHTSLGQTFNGITTVDWSFTDDVVCIDLTEPRKAGDVNLDLFYAQAIGTIFRYMRSSHRDRTRKTLLVIDEFGLASRISSVSQMAVTISKVARKYGMALVTADQLPNIYLDTPDGQQILGNTRVKVIFHLADPEARRIAQAIPEMTETHIQYITQRDVGRCVIVYDNIAVPVVVEPAGREMTLFQGS
jgi:type IV secretory pathway VirB4 component